MSGLMKCRLAQTSTCSTGPVADPLGVGAGKAAPHGSVGLGGVELVPPLELPALEAPPTLEPPVAEPPVLAPPMPEPPLPIAPELPLDPASALAPALLPPAAPAPVLFPPAAPPELLEPHATTDPAKAS